MKAMKTKTVVPIDEFRVREIFNEMFDDMMIAHQAAMEVKPELTWRDEAKELGVPLTKEAGGARKKVDVIADIAKKKSPEKDVNDSPVTAEQE